MAPNFKLVNSTVQNQDDDSHTEDNNHINRLNEYINNTSSVPTFNYNDDIPTLVEINDQDLLGHPTSTYLVEFNSQYNILIPQIALTNTLLQTSFFFGDDRFNFVRRPFGSYSTYRKERTENQIQENFDKLDKEKYLFQNEHTDLRQNLPNFHIIISKPPYSCNNTTSTQLHHFKCKYKHR